MLRGDEIVGALKRLDYSRIRIEQSIATAPKQRIQKPYIVDKFESRLLNVILEADEMKTKCDLSCGGIEFSKINAASTDANVLRAEHIGFAGLQWRKGSFEGSCDAAARLQNVPLIVAKIDLGAVEFVLKLLVVAAAYHSARLRVTADRVSARFGPSEYVPVMIPNLEIASVPKLQVLKILAVHKVCSPIIARIVSQVIRLARVGWGGVG